MSRQFQCFVGLKQSKRNFGGREAEREAGETRDEEAPPGEVLDYGVQGITTGRSLEMRKVAYSSWISDLGTELATAKDESLEERDREPNRLGANRGQIQHQSSAKGLDGLAHPSPEPTHSSIDSLAFS